MAFRIVTISALGGLFLMTGFGPSMLLSATSTTVAAAASCEPYVKPPTTATPPRAPTGVRVISGGAFDDESDSIFESDSMLEWDSTFEAAEEYAGTEPTLADTLTHAYFDALSLRTDCIAAYSLRNMDQLLQYMDSTTVTWDVTYGPETDPDSRRQDAAKILIPANKVSLPNNVRLPIPPVDKDSLFVTWDSWLGREFDPDLTGIWDQKHFQFTSPAGRIWTEIKADFQWGKKFPGAIAVAKVRAYGHVKNGELGAEVTTENPLSPMAGIFAMAPETWTRYWVYFNPVGEWHEFSLWVADVNRDPVLVIDRLRMKPNYEAGATGWEKFWLEYNTSSKGLETGFSARVAYARNLVMLRGVTDPKPLLQRPVR